MKTVVDTPRHICPPSPTTVCKYVGLSLEVMAGWSQEQQKSRLQEAFPLMSVGKINQVLKKLRLSIYDNKSNSSALCERPPSAQVAAERMRVCCLSRRVQHQTPLDALLYSRFVGTMAPLCFLIVKFSYGKFS